jgi:hypothetical protein
LQDYDCGGEMGIMMNSKFGNNHVRIYTKGMTLWTPSFKLVHLVHDGKWVMPEQEDLEWGEDVFWVAKMTLQDHRWEYD